MPFAAASCNGAPDTSVMEAALHDAMQNFAAKQFLRSVEGKLTVQEQLDRTERPKEVSSFGHEQAAIPEHRRQRALPGVDCPGPYLGVLNPFTDAILQQAAVEEQRLSAIPGQAWVYARQPGKEKKQARDMEALCAEVRDDGDQAPSVLPLQHRQSAADGTRQEQLRPSLACCLVSRAAALGSLAVGAEPGEKVLDLCPGSGAKALVLATALFAAPGPATEGLPWLQSVGQETGVLGGYCNGDAGERTHSSTSLLVCNEPSRQRAQRLEALLGSFLPSEVPITSGSAGKPAHGLAGRVVITKAEGTDKPSLLPLQRLGPFDKVLVDPTCRTEREGKATEVAEALLRSAAQLVRPGGRVIFCGATAEAELVVQRFMRKAGQDFEVVPPGPLAAPISAEAFTCEFGTMVPAGPASSGHGPLYVAQLQRQGK